MFNQEKTGKFIADMRREQNLTQKQLAEMVGVSDKTVSKWETARSFPDNSVLMDLCLVLKVSVNELLSGERVPKEQYEERAEETIMTLVKENENQRKKDREDRIGTLLGYVLLISVCIFTIVLMEGTVMLSNYWDFPTLIMLVIIVLGVLITCGQLKAFGRSFAVVYGKKQYSKEEIDSSYFAMKTTVFTVPIVCMLETLVAMVAMLNNLEEASSIGPNLAVALLMGVYCCIFELLLVPTMIRLRQQLHTNISHNEN